MMNDELKDEMFAFCFSFIVHHSDFWLFSS